MKFSKKNKFLLKNKNKLYDRVLKYYGQECQLDKLEEECAELIVACKHMREDISEFPNFLEEIADVEIMIDQMKILWGISSDIQKIKKRKLIRLLDRIGGT